MAAGATESKRFVRFDLGRFRQIVYVRELASRRAVAPQDHPSRTCHFRVMEFADVGLLKVKVVAGSVEVRWHR